MDTEVAVPIRPHPLLCAAEARQQDRISNTPAQEPPCYIDHVTVQCPFAYARAKRELPEDAAHEENLGVGAIAAIGLDDEAPMTAIVFDGTGQQLHCPAARRGKVWEDSVG